MAASVPPVGENFIVVPDDCALLEPNKPAPPDWAPNKPPVVDVVPSNTKRRIGGSTVQVLTKRSSRLLQKTLAFKKPVTSIYSRTSINQWSAEWRVTDLSYQWKTKKLFLTRLQNTTKSTKLIMTCRGSINNQDKVLSYTCICVFVAKLVAIRSIQIGTNYSHKMEKCCKQSHWSSELSKDFWITYCCFIIYRL